MTTTQQPRALGLDALRGLSILLMVFSGRIPFGVLPDWMYHAQVPPPDHTFNPNIPGITWVDLVFPFFLFTMGAAIPLALSRKLDRSTPQWKIIVSVFSRGLLLAAFAMYVMHIRPWLMNPNPDAYVWILCLVGFLLLFPMYTRFPQAWSRTTQLAVRTTGWIGAIALLAIVRFNDGSSFSVQRSDIIILVLSNVAVAGAIIWMFTRENHPLRIGILGFLAALILSSSEEGWTKWFMNSSPAPWLFQFRFQKYLFLVIPGTIVGDWLLEWMKSANPETLHNDRSPGTILLALLMLMTNIIVVVGLKWRWVVPALGATIGLCSAAWFIVTRSLSPTEQLMKKIFQLAFFVLMLGFALEPFEGGIKKDHSTMSYYFVTGGLAMMMLIALIIAVEVYGKKRWLNLLVTSGQNPLIAYAAVNSLVPPLLGLLMLEPAISNLTSTPLLGVLRGAFMTYLVAVAASVCTKRGILLKT